MAAPASLLEARDVTRRAEDGTVLLDGASLSIEAGSRTAITGPPGSGKTLLLRTLALLDPLQGGEVRFRGNAIADPDVPAIRRQIPLVLQRPVLVEGTVRDNLRLPFSFGESSASDFDESRIIDLLKQTGREAAFLERQVDDLSGGESQIVALLRVIQLDPIVLLLDEPTSSLDAETTTIVERLINDWQQTDDERALVIVTHTQAQAARMATRTIHLQNGGLTADG